MKELISIIVPIYNVEAYLERCLDSLVGQTYSNIEIILVDDGSTDHCPEICDIWERKDPRIKVIHKENGGLSDARNVGIKKVSGDYIIFVDSDDWLHRDMIKILADIRMETNADIVECQAKKVTEYVKDDSINFKEINIRQFSSREALEALIDENILKQTVWNKLYKKDVIDCIQFEYGKYHEDEFWTYQVLARAEKIIFVDIELYYYFQRNDSIMGQAFSLNRLDAIEGRYRRLEFLKRYYNEKEFEVKKNLFFLILYYGQQALMKKEKKEIKIYFKTAKEYLSKINFTTEQIREFSFCERIWVEFGRKNLTVICVIRNILGIGK